MKSGKNGCDAGGDQFACSCLQPWVTLLTPPSRMGLRRTMRILAMGGLSALVICRVWGTDQNGKPMKIRKMILQNVNTSPGIMKGGFDVQLAGGGVGITIRGVTISGVRSGVGRSMVELIMSRLVVGFLRVFVRLACSGLLCLATIRRLLVLPRECAARRHHRYERIAALRRCNRQRVQRPDRLHWLSRQGQVSA